MQSGGGEHQPAAEAPRAEGRRPARAPAGPLKPEQVAKLLSELDVVRRNMDVMNEVLTEIEPGKESEEETQLLDVRHHSSD